ncbi:MAG: DDE-type integrase/transposase/recombinase [Pseudomonadota bacterium]
MLLRLAFLNAVFVKLNGDTHARWWPGDHEGKALKAYTTKTRNKVAALKFLKKAMKR